MKRLVPLLGAALALALSGTAAADTFRVARSHTSGGAIEFTTGTPTGAMAFTAMQSEPTRFAELRGIWQAAGAAYGIPWEVLAAINKVETDFGRNLGPSSAGAIGWMQFMPSTWARWGVDANGDGVADPNNPTDAIFSAARYLAACGGQTNISAAIYCYNHSDWYVNDVLGLAALYGRSGVGGGLVSLNPLQSQLDTASQQIATAKSQIASARARARALGRAANRFLHVVNTAPLLSDQLAAQKRATLLGLRRDAVLARIARLRRLIHSATERLNNAQAGGLSLGDFSSLQIGRIDQGVDLTSGHPYPALASGRVVYIDPNFWRGTPAVYEKLDVPVVVNGQMYDELYYSETQALVRVGQRLVPGEPVIAAGSAELGFARGNLPAAHGLYHEGDATAAGSDFFTYLTAGSLGSDPLGLLGSPLGSFQPGSGAAMSFTTTGDGTAFTPNVVYFTH
jgi:transglycosylase-like protein with SLT domain